MAVDQLIRKYLVLHGQTEQYERVRQEYVPKQLSNQELQTSNLHPEEPFMDPHNRTYIKEEKTEPYKDVKETKEISMRQVDTQGTADTHTADTQGTADTRNVEPKHTRTKRRKPLVIPQIKVDQDIQVEVRPLTVPAAVKKMLGLECAGRALARALARAPHH